MPSSGVFSQRQSRNGSGYRWRYSPGRT